MEKENLMHFNCFFKKIDSILGTFDQEFLNNIDSHEKRKMSIDSIYQNAIIQLQDIRDSLKGNLDLTNALSEGSPKPIFNKKKHNQANSDHTKKLLG